jgi:hypothetical protein
MGTNDFFPDAGKHYNGEFQPGGSVGFEIRFMLNGKVE